MKKKLWSNVLVIIAIAVANYTEAEDLGQIGKVYPIGEQNLMNAIKNRAQQLVNSGQWESYRKQLVMTTENYIDNPPSLNLTPTVESSVRYYDPSIVLTQDVIDPQTKKVLGRKGQSINPTKYMPFNNLMVFIDARDESQVIYAKHLDDTSPLKVSVISVAAKDLRKTMVDNDLLIFYDQKGVYINKFGLKHVPTIIYQDESYPSYLKIEEVKL